MAAIRVVLLLSIDNEVYGSDRVDFKLNYMYTSSSEKTRVRPLVGCFLVANISRNDTCAQNYFFQFYFQFFSFLNELEENR